jgi:hypothetical protein
MSVVGGPGADASASAAAALATAAASCGCTCGIAGECGREAGGGRGDAECDAISDRKRSVLVSVRGGGEKQRELSCKAKSETSWRGSRSPVTTQSATIRNDFHTVPESLPPAAAACGSQRRDGKYSRKPERQKRNDSESTQPSAAAHTPAR